MCTSSTTRPFTLKLCRAHSWNSLRPRVRGLIVELLSGLAAIKGMQPPGQEARNLRHPKPQATHQQFRSRVKPSERRIAKPRENQRIAELDKPAALEIVGPFRETEAGSAEGTCRGIAGSDAVIKRLLWGEAPRPLGIKHFFLNFLMPKIPWLGGWNLQVVHCFNVNCNATSR